jgi:octaprenyl-diphosphate synthase
MMQADAAMMAKLTSALFFLPVEQDLQRVRAALQGLGRDLSESIRPVMEYAALDRGKLLRPALLLLWGRALGTITQEHIRAATVLEIIHNATLLHDDVLDQGCLRRGVPTTNQRWGNRSAVLLGDLLLGKVLEWSADFAPDLRATLSRTILQTCDGEIRQTVSAGNFAMTEQEYLAVIGQKTAALFKESCYMGAYLAGGSSRERRAAADFGYHVGTTYQIMDDLLDAAGDGETLCKTLGTDLRSAKPTLPLIHALCVLPAADRTPLLLKLQARAARDRELFEVLAASGSVDYVLKRLREHADQALEALRPLRRSRMKTALMAVPEWIVQQAREGLVADSGSVYARHQAYAG